MPFNDCRDFVSECGCGERHVVDPSYFNSIKDDYDNHIWTISHINFETIKPEKPKNGQNKKLTVCIQSEGKQHSFHFDSNGNFAGQGCICEPLLFIIVNFEISDQVLKNLLIAIKDHKDCWMLDRYDDEMLSLIQHLKKKKNTKEIISFFRKTWFHYYKIPFLKRVYFRYLKKPIHSQ